MGKFNMLPEEIMLEILSRVPAESILRCKSVSKPWRNLIQHSSFPQMHLSHLDSGELNIILYSIGYEEDELFYYAEYYENLNSSTRTTRINLRPEFKDSYILDSVNGLVCFNAYLGNCYDHPAYICNPITREYIVLPNIESTKLFLCGFGHTPSTNEYKVVRIPQCRGDTNYGIIQVYTLGSGMGWRNVKKVDTNLVYFNQCGVFANGAIHWVEYPKGRILSFDLVDEEFRELPSPPLLSPVDVVLHGFGDFLYASDRRYSGDIDIWVLKDYKIWSKEFSSISGRPINFTKSLGLLSYDYRDKNVYFYASKNLSSRMLVSSGDNFKYGVPHRNTLVSLRTLGEEHAKLMDSGGSIDHLSTEQKEQRNCSSSIYCTCSIPPNFVVS